MAKLETGDKFIVNRGDTVKKAEATDLMATIQDTDWMLINRADAVQKISGADVKTSLGKSPIYPEADEITTTPSFQGGTGTELDPFILQPVDVRPGGAVAVSVEQITLDVAGATEGQPVIWTDNSTGAAARFTQPSGVTAADGTWTGRLVYSDTPETLTDTDYLGQLRIGDVYFEWAVHQGIDPVRPIKPTPDEVTAVPDFVSGNGTQAEPYVLSPALVAPKGGSAQSGQEITIAEDGASAGELVRWIDNSVDAGARFAQPEALADADGKWVGNLLYQDTPPTDDDEIYTGDLQIGEVYFRWEVTQWASNNIRPEPDDVTANPDFQSGSGTFDDPYVLQEIEVVPAGTGGLSVETLTITAPRGQENLPIEWVVVSGVGRDGISNRFTQPVGVTGPGGVWTGQLIYTDTPETAVDQSYTGVLQLGEVFFSWTVNQRVSLTEPPVLTNVSLVEANPDADPRFTEQQFVASSSLSEEGTPVSTKTFDAYVEGKITTKAQFIEPLVSSTPSGDLAKKVWSNGLSVNVGVVTAPQNAFNGMVGNQCICDNNSICTWTIEGGVISGVLKVYTSKNVTGEVYVDGVSQGQSFTGDTGVLYATCDLSQTVSIQCLNSATSIRAIEINNNIITDNSSISPAVPSTLAFAADADMVALAPGDEVSQLGSSDLFTDTDYSGYQPSNMGWSNPGGAPVKMFDGDPSTKHTNVKTSGKVELKFDAAMINIGASDVGLLWWPGTSNIDVEWVLSGTVQATTDSGAFVSQAAGRYFYPPAGTSFDQINIVCPGNPYTAGEFYGITYYGALLTDGINVQARAAGTVGSKDGTTVTLSASNGTWTNGEDVTGPEKIIVLESAKKHLEFDSSGAVSGLLSSPQDPPYQTTDANPGLTLTFPATFPSGNTPDEELGEGATLTVEVTASNEVGLSGPLSAEVQPEGASGPDVGPALNGLTTLYTGNGTAGRKITTGIDLVNNDGLIWIKNRTGTNQHCLFDTINGPSQYLASNESTPIGGTPYAITAFLDNGFELGAEANVNSNNYDYAAWSFQKAEGYFDVIKYSGNDTSQVLTHALATKPGLIITKVLAFSGPWYTYHASIGTNKYVRLNENNEARDSAWLGAEPTDTTFTVGGSEPTLANVSGREYIAYLFAEDTPGVIKCGEYPGNGADQTIDVGFKPQWILIKCTNEAGRDWTIKDNKRVGFDLYANKTDPDKSEPAFAFVDNGFNLQDGSARVNKSGNNYIYVAIATPPAARSLTDEELAKQKLLFGTYDNRAAVKAGEEAIEARTVLAAKLKESGYTDAQIQDALGGQPKKKGRKKS